MLLMQSVDLGSVAFAIFKWDGFCENKHIYKIFFQCVYSNEENLQVNGRIFDPSSTMPYI